MSVRSKFRDVSMNASVGEKPVQRSRRNERRGSYQLLQYSTARHGAHRGSHAVGVERAIEKTYLSCGRKQCETEANPGCACVCWNEILAYVEATRGEQAQRELAAKDRCDRLRARDGGGRYSQQSDQEASEALRVRWSSRLKDDGLEEQRESCCNRG